MHYITAVFGERYYPLFLGFIRSFITYCPDAQLKVYTDQKDLQVWNSDTVTVDTSFKRRHLYRFVKQFWPPRKRFSTYFRGITLLKLLFLGKHFESHSSDVCWTDCDQLILDNMDNYLKPGRINVFSLGCGERIRNCGNGLFIPQHEFAIGGLYTIPNAHVYEDLSSLAYERNEWELKGEKSGEQTLLNHLIQRNPELKFDLSDKYKDRVFDWSEWITRPNPENPRLRSIIKSNEGFYINNRRIVLFYFENDSIREHLADDFNAFPAEIGSAFRHLYRRT